MLQVDLGRADAHRILFCRQNFLSARRRCDLRHESAHAWVSRAEHARSRAESSGGLNGDCAEALGGPGQGYVQVPLPTGAGRDDLLGVHDDDPVELQAARRGEIRMT